jgi:HSP90 family molecular chaperone
METCQQNKTQWACTQSKITDDEYGKFSNSLTNDWEK